MTESGTCGRCGQAITGTEYLLDAIMHPDVGTVGECCLREDDLVLEEYE